MAKIIKIEIKVMGSKTIINITRNFYDIESAIDYLKEIRRQQNEKTI